MNLNDTPIKRFQDSQFFDKHSEYIASQAFVEACKEALLQMIHDTPNHVMIASEEAYAGLCQQIIGAKCVLNILGSLGIKQNLDRPRRTDGLNYAAK